jgi:hypothetical protein
VLVECVRRPVGGIQPQPDHAHEIQPRCCGGQRGLPNGLLALDRRERAIAQTKRIAFARLRAVDDLACHQISQRVDALGQTKRTTGILECRRYRLDLLRVESATLQ